MSLIVGVADPLPRNPAVAEAPGASEEFHSGAWIIANGPLCIDVPFHAWVIVAPFDICHWTYQPLSGPVPVFLIVTSPWKPPCQVLVSFTVAVQAGFPAVGEAEGLGDGLLVGEASATGSARGWAWRCR